MEFLFTYVCVFCVFAIGLARTGCQVNANEELEQERTRRILLEDNYYTIMKRLDELTNKTQSLESKVSSLENELARKSTSTVAFRAHLNTSLPQLAPKQLIDFSAVRLNTGHAFHGGTFIAPLNGTYMFSVYICSPVGHWIVVDLMKNGVIIGQIRAGDTSYHECSSQTVVAELRAGDDVNVHYADGDGGVLGNDLHLDTFTGVLLDKALF